MTLVKMMAFAIDSGDNDGPDCYIHTPTSNLTIYISSDDDGGDENWVDDNMYQ